MAPPPGTLRTSRYFGALGLILAVLYLLVLLPGNANTPKLGIDLVGGIRVIFTAKPPAGQAITNTAMEQARQIIENRINDTGVTASTVQIQGDDQLVVQIPGGTSTDVKRLGQAAQLNFRPLVAPASPVTCGTAASAATPSTSGSSAPSSAAPSAAPSGAASSGATASASGSDAPNSRNERRLAAPTPTGSATRAAATTPAPATTGAATTGAATTGGATTPAPTSGAASSSAAPVACVANPIAVVQKADPKLVLPTSEAAYDKLTTTQKSELAAALANVDCNTTNRLQDDPKKPYVACENQSGTNIAYLLGPVIVKGEQVDEASAVAPSQGQGGSTQWTVSLTLKDSGKTAWGNWTTAHNSNSSTSNTGATACGTAAGGLPCADFVAFTLDGKVLSAPVTNEPIVGQATQISGNFKQKSANALADSLKFGALPLTFNLESNERVSASLGTSQLQAALLAGGIGLALVVLYSLLYYRGLGLVTIASLVVSGLLTYAMMVILGQQIGFTLDLSGIAGLIVALGITADSFVVFFERIKDEVHEGRSIRVAIPRAWVRARRTVLSADTVSFLAAAILYYFASADVKGFAFTLGLSTILDLVVVFLFTHPIVSLLARSRTFGSPRFTGLNSVRAGGITADREVPRAKRAATKRRARTGGTVVLDKQDTVEDELDPVDDTDVEDLETDDTADTTVDVDGDTTEEPRRRTTPAGGTAAERAAARRARQRTQRDEGNA